MVWILPLFIIVIMVFSAFGYFINDNRQAAYDYNGFKFTQQQNYWLLTIDGKNIPFQYHPTDLERINSSTIQLSDDVYLTYDPEMPGLSYVDLVRLDLSEFLSDKNVYSGVSKPSNGTLPLVICGSVNGTVIELALGNESIILGNGNCYTLQAESNYDLARVSERFKYQVLGVMNASS